MKKLRSVVCLLLAIILLFGSLPAVLADSSLLPNETLENNPRYAHSFLLSIESQSKQEYTLADFPNIEHLYLVKTVKMTETETGYCYLLLMAIDNYNLDQAKKQASAYGSVSVNYFASDYIEATSYMQLNYTSLEMKVGETIELRPAVRDLTPIRYALSGVMFTVDPTVIDEAALVESEYQNMGLRTTIGAEDISMISWQYNMGIIWNGPYSPQNTISPIHTYYGLTYSNNILDVAHNLANQEGVESVCLVYEHAVYTAEAAYVRYSCDTEGIVAMDNNYNAYGDFRIAITAVQPGEVTITAKAGGGGLGSATATCKITVVEDTPDIPQYAHSFLLSIESQSKQKYTLADFPNIEHLYLVKTVKMTETETGYCYLLLMAIDNYNLDQAKKQAAAYGSVSENYLAPDYADVTSYMRLNYTSLEMKVGETIELKPADLSLTSSRRVLAGIMFTVDPTVIDEAALVESEYQNMGFYTIYGMEDISMLSWHKDVAVVWDNTSSAEETISPIHTYYGMWNFKSNLFDAVHDLANQEGIVSVYLGYEPADYAAVQPYVHYSCNPEIVTVDSHSVLNCTVTAVQPGEVTITAKAGGGGLGSATATCKITVVEDTPDIPQTPTDPPADIPYGDVNGDKKVNAEDALTVLKYVVRKIDLTEAQKLAAEVDGNDSISASDALEILKFTVNKITNFPIEVVSADACLLT